MRNAILTKLYGPFFWGGAMIVLSFFGPLFQISFLIYLISIGILKGSGRPRIKYSYRQEAMYLDNIKINRSAMKI